MLLGHPKVVRHIDERPKEQEDGPAHRVQIATDENPVEEFYMEDRVPNRRRGNKRWHRDTLVAHFVAVLLDVYKVEVRDLP